jgi:hypothetical protein
MKGDLVVVVADGGIEQAIRGLLTRAEALGIRPLHGVEFPKLHKLDCDTFATGHQLASLYRPTHEHALIVLDLAWDGRPINDPLEMSRQVDERLRPDWGDSGRCVVIDPELEAWVWSDSPHVAKVLGWTDLPELASWLSLKGLWPRNSPKPPDPKSAYLAAIREKRIQNSNALFRTLAEKVSLTRCEDRAFLALREILRAWFPPPPCGVTKAAR